MNTSEISAIHRAVRLMGSQLNLARQLQVTPVTVNQWLRPAGAKNARPIPPKQCVRIEQVTGGAVTRKDLRPDDFAEIWPEADRPDWQPATPQPTTEPAQAGA